MNYPKFIITQNGQLRLGMVALHKHLLLPGDTCLGGGYWRINHALRQVELSGESSDYGRPQWHRLTHIYSPEGYEGYSWTWTQAGRQYPLSEIIAM